MEKNDRHPPIAQRWDRLRRVPDADIGRQQRAVVAEFVQSAEHRAGGPDAGGAAIPPAPWDARVIGEPFDFDPKSMAEIMAISIGKEVARAEQLGAGDLQIAELLAAIRE